MNIEQIAARLEVSCFYPTDILVGAVEAIVREAVEAAKAQVFDSLAAEAAKNGNDILAEQIRARYVISKTEAIRARGEVGE